MNTRSFIGIILTLSIVASGALLANAEKLAAGQSVETKIPDKKSPAKSADSTKAKTDNDHKMPALPILMELSSLRETYRSREDLMIKAELWAIQPVTICLYTENPEARFAVDVYRAGYGKLKMPPSVQQLGYQDAKKVERIKLEPGQMHRVVFNVKKLIPAPPYFWKTGEYRIQAKFFLCGQTEGAEQEIPSQGPLHLLILE